ncbi:carbohydrate sulfotransferase 11-like [Glandiceps talaboti]
MLMNFQPTVSGAIMKTNRRFCMVFCTSVILVLITYNLDVFKRSTDKYVMCTKTSKPLLKVVTTPTEALSVAKLHSRRKRLLDAICYNNSRSTISNVNLRRTGMFVDHKHKFMFCMIAKVGSSNWQRAFLNLSGRSLKPNRSIHHHRVPSLRDMSQADQEYALREYAKVIFVRHPFERLLSVFLDKFIQKPEFSFQKRYGEQIRNSPSNTKSNGSRKITFDKFVNFLLHYRVDNIHWLPYTELCLPCQIKYDYIGTFDTLQSDVEYIFGKLNISLNYPSSAGHATNSSKRTFEFYRQLTPGQILKLYDMYSDDFKIFQYNFPYDYLSNCAM